jgi:hypothetical protein
MAVGAVAAAGMGAEAAGMAVVAEAAGMAVGAEALHFIALLPTVACPP